MFPLEPTKRLNCPEINKSVCEAQAEIDYWKGWLRCANSIGDLSKGELTEMGEKGLTKAVKKAQRALDTLKLPPIPPKV